MYMHTIGVGPKQNGAPTQINRWETGIKIQAGRNCHGDGSDRKGGGVALWGAGINLQAWQ